MKNQQKLLPINRNSGKPASSCRKFTIVFVKSPIPGEVKSRLIPFLTGTEAADLYQQFVVDTVNHVGRLAAEPQIWIAYQPTCKYPNLSWLHSKRKVEMFKQEGSHLGEKLIHAFGTAFGKGAQQVIIVGSDCPNLPAAYMEQAFSMLNDSDVVLGPSSNGGYYLVGLSRPCMKLFDHVIWSSDQVFERTVQNAHQQNYRVKILPPHYDTNTTDDLKLLQNDLQKNPSAAPMTHACLRQILKQKSEFSVV